MLFKKQYSGYKNVSNYSLLKLHDQLHQFLMSPECPISWYLCGYIKVKDWKLSTVLCPQVYWFGLNIWLLQGKGMALYKTMWGFFVFFFLFFTDREKHFSL